jgi:acid phosphatase
MNPAKHRQGFLTGLLFALLSLLLIGCTHQAARTDPHEMLNATLWQQGSAEYIGVVNQAWLLAHDNLDKALADPQWTAAIEQTGSISNLPPAIMLDLDETVLDNSAYEARIIKQLGQYTHDSFADWCRESTAPAVIGAKAFLDYAAEQGVAIFYYSARREKLRDCTLRNLHALQLPLPDESRLFLSNGMSKSSYRSQVAQQYRILLLVGDNMEDFIDGFKTGPGVRRSLAHDYADRWGRQWIILPNPMYGHWESSIYNFDYALPREEQLKHKMQELKE